jgi:hypothetical protein
MEADSEDKVYWDILESCWNVDPDQRPEVSMILEKLSPPSGYAPPPVPDSRAAVRDIDTSLLNSSSSELLQEPTSRGSAQDSASMGMGEVAKGAIDRTGHASTSRMNFLSIGECSLSSQRCKRRYICR